MSTPIANVASPLTVPGWAGATLPALFAPTPAAATRTVEFFTAHIRNPNRRRASLRALATSVINGAIGSLREVSRLFGPTFGNWTPTPCSRRKRITDTGLVAPTSR